MKVQIRQSVFETNSSSEHSLSIVKKSNYFAWKDGQLYAKRSSKKTEFKETWGNFWSEQWYWDFSLMDITEAEEKNEKIFDENIKSEKESIRLYAEMYKGPEHDEYIKYREARLNEKEAKGYDNLKPLDKMYDGFWITYDEYQEALRHDDCYSPFVHVNNTEDVVVFGKYYHS